MKFLELCNEFEKIEATASRNEITEILLELFKKLDVYEAQIVSYLIQGRLAPLFVNSEFNFSEKGMLAVLERIERENGGKRDVLEMRKKLGDIGLVASEINLGANETSLRYSIKDMYKDLWTLVNFKGNESVKKKQEFLVKILNFTHNLSNIEAKYISRIVVGNLRLGTSVKTLLDTFSFVLNGDKGMREKLDKAYGSSADIGYIAKKVFSNEDISKVSATPGIPVLSRLVERSKSFENVIERMGNVAFFVQPKFDGLRLQIHKSKEGFENVYKERIWYEYMEKERSQIGLFQESKEKPKVRLFTRNLEDVTNMFPEIVAFAEKIPSSFILDSEVVGWDYKKNIFKSYQDTMTRKRKYEVSQTQENIPVRAFTFDILFLEDKDLISSDTSDRLLLLNDVIKEDGMEIEKAENVEIQTVDELKKYFEKWVGMGLEGLIAKKRAGGYTPGGRDFDWIKLKKSFLTELNDTLDLIVLGYYLGSGKRASFGMGALLCGILNEETEMLEGMCKVGTGITDDMWGIISKRLLPLKVEKMPKNVSVSKILLPDVWVVPEVVCTIEADQVTKAINKGEGALAGGYSLRFPRMIEFDREKNVDEITKISELGEIK